MEETDIKKLSRKELYSRLGSLSGVSWIDSEEFKELERRLNTYTYERLKEEGYDIPNAYSPNVKLETPKKLNK